MFEPVNLLESASKVDEAKVQVDVEKEYASPFEVMARPPADKPETERFVKLADEVAVIEPTVSLPAVVEAR